MLRRRAWSSVRPPRGGLRQGDDAPRAAGEPIAALVHDESVRHDPELIEAVAAAARLALTSERLQAEVRAQLEEVRASRARIVEAGDRERRRVERNIHDGAQQQLVALMVKLRLTDALLERDPAKAHEMLAQMRADMNDALEDLRDLARGIYPPLLADQGLAAALEAQARKSSVSVSVDAGGIGRYGPEQPPRGVARSSPRPQRVHDHVHLVGGEAHDEELLRRGSDKAERTTLTMPVESQVGLIEALARGDYDAVLAIEFGGLPSLVGATGRSYHWPVIASGRCLSTSSSITLRSLEVESLKADEDSTEEVSEPPEHGRAEEQT